MIGYVDFQAHTRGPMIDGGVAAIGRNKLVEKFVRLCLCGGGMCACKSALTF